MNKVNKNDERLIRMAKSLIGSKEINGGSVKDVGCVLVTMNGILFSGVNLNLSCGIGFCAEHTAISQMITKTDETHIHTIVAAKQISAIPPCGRCRELIYLIDIRNIDTFVIISDSKKVRLRDLLPFCNR